MLAKEIDGGFRGFCHIFHQHFFGRPSVPVFRQIIDGDAVHLTLADAAVSAADGEILHGAAEAAHGVAFEMSEYHHGVIIHDVAAHGDFLEVLAAANGKVYRAFFVHDVYGAEGPAIHFQCFLVTFGGEAVAFIERIGFYDIAVRHLGLEGFHHVPWENVWPVLLAGVQLDGGLAIDGFIDETVELDEMRRIDDFGEIYFGMGARRAALDAGGTNDRCLLECFHKKSSFAIWMRESNFLIEILSVV